MEFFDIVIFELIRNFIRELMDRLTYHKLLGFGIGYKLLLLGMEVGLRDLGMGLGLFFACFLYYKFRYNIIYLV